ncbi:MAG: DNA topoisomerase (ATP-hydrolyzing) subunit A [Spirochaetales bacterium]|nr:DNA topoisomerase (ATP-hydrolyzing) subunit A [Spirochaetales bacterium]
MIEKIKYEEKQTPEGGYVLTAPIEHEMQRSFIDYSMSVIVERALPDVRDGLKPVHRRILYAMAEEGLTSGGKTKKCATVVGDVLGRYHPHGDASVYDAMVRLGQAFSLRYMPVTKQGNFGGIDGSPAAAYRYTEAKMSKVAEVMVEDIKKDTVDFSPNFDDTRQEPKVLPAAFPFLLCNGSTGIAVGMATNMPPHNLREVGGAICAYIDNPECTIEDLMLHMKGPDFPTGGIIFGKKGIADAYKTGRGKILLRARFTIEVDTKGKEKIVFTEIPYQTRTTDLVTKIGELARDGVIEGIDRVNDGSHGDDVRIEIDIKKTAIAKIVINQIFAKTALQTSYGIINLALVPSGNGLAPQVLNLKQLIKHFVDHRDEVITRRCKFELAVAKKKEHILEAKITAVDCVDEVIQIIRSSKDEPEAKKRLEARFGFDEEQSQAIVDLRLGVLTSLRIDELKIELEQVRAEIARLEDLLAHHEKILNLIKEETNVIVEKFGDDRKTDIVAGEVETINVEDMIKEEDMVVLISKVGYIKRVPVSQYKSQGRGGKGTISAKLVEEDYINQMFVASTHDYLMFITTAGKAYWVKVHEIPEASKTGRGSHVKSLLTLGNEDITTTVALKDFKDDEFLFMATANGVVKKTPTSEFKNAKARGTTAVRLDDGDTLVSSILTSGSDEILLVSRRGQALRIEENDVRPMGKTSRGVAGIKLGSSDELASAIRIEKEDDARILVITEKGIGKRVDPAEFNAHGRGTGGQKIFGNVDDKGEIIGSLCVRESDSVMCITSQGTSVRVEAKDITIQGRSASGIKVVTITDPDYVVGVDRIANEDEEK